MQLQSAGLRRKTSLTLSSFWLVHLQNFQLPNICLVFVRCKSEWNEHRTVHIKFDQCEGSSDGGALLLKAADRHYGLVDELAACLRDQRQAGKVDHGLRELVAQRVFLIDCGST